MKTNKIYDITFDTDETIMAATLAKANEVVMLMSSGIVIRFNMADQNVKRLFSVKSNITYSDGGFDITAKTSIYTMDEIVVVVNDRKTHGFIHHPGKYHALPLCRADYHADISTYPIALFKNIDGVPHLVFGVAWNHVQIMNLDTRQVLTASKSLIEEGAEEKHIEFYKKHAEGNMLLWPTHYDYFFGKLFISPNQKKFLSAGWAWGSCDCYHIYDIENFITNNRISDLRVGAWEHNNRPTCWIDNETIAVAYNPFWEGDENATKDSSHEIHIHKICGNKVELEKTIQTAEHITFGSSMYFNAAMNSFVTVSEKTGLSVISLDGQTTFKDENIKSNEYSLETSRLLVADNKTIVVYELANM